jgi:hypothetical protein
MYSASQPDHHRAPLGIAVAETGIRQWFHGLASTVVRQSGYAGQRVRHECEQNAAMRSNRPQNALPAARPPETRGTR